MYLKYDILFLLRKGRCAAASSSLRAALAALSRRAHGLCVLPSTHFVEGLAVHRRPRREEALVNRVLAGAWRLVPGRSYPWLLVLDRVPRRVLLACSQHDGPVLGIIVGPGTGILSVLSRVLVEPVRLLLVEDPSWRTFLSCRS